MVNENESDNFFRSFHGILEGHREHLEQNRCSKDTCQWSRGHPEILK